MLEETGVLGRKSLCCLFFFDLRILIIPFVSSPVQRSFEYINYTCINTKSNQSQNTCNIQSHTKTRLCTKSNTILLRKHACKSYEISAQRNHLFIQYTIWNDTCVLFLLAIKFSVLFGFFYDLRILITPLVSSNSSLIVLSGGISRQNIVNTTLLSSTVQKIVMSTKIHNLYMLNLIC